MRIGVALFLALLTTGCAGALPRVMPTPPPAPTGIAEAVISPAPADGTIATPRAAVNPAGVYAVSGTTAFGLPYDGTMRIAGPGPVFQVEWQTGIPYRGVGVVAGKALGVGFGGDVCGVTTYVREGSVLTGQWVSVGMQRVGAEQARQTAAGDDLAGAYRVAGRNPDGSPYDGELNVIRRGEVYQFSWKIPTEFDGVGVEQDDHVTVGWGGASCGVAQYLVQPTGDLRGLLGAFGQNRAGRETAQRQQ
jgi:hypothetical protein